jgi:hypothetical protein
MENQLVLTNHSPTNLILEADKPFIEANTEPMLLEEIREKHIIPVFAKNNETTISQVEFINLIGEIAETTFQQRIDPVEIRVSHPIKGRIPSARYKAANDLLPHEKTLYYERCAFLFKIPGISRTINGQEIQLTVGGIKAYNLDNLHRYGGSPQVFKIFIGFQVKVCCNLCIFTDGSKDQIKATNAEQLGNYIQQLFQSFDDEYQYQMLRQLVNDGITDAQFATLIGRTRMYMHMPPDSRKSMQPMLLSDSQINAVVKGYYTDPNFGIETQEMSYWNLYNLFTTATKGSYIDSFLTRNCNSLEFSNYLIQHPNTWFLN